MTEHRDTDDLFAGGDRTEASPAPAAAAAPAAPMAHAGSAAAGVGARLRAAREKRGLALADCARALHLPVKVLQRLEADDFGAADDFVFQRGALRGYARLLELPPGSFDASLRTVAPPQQPALVAVARTSRAHWLLQRYGTAATYIVLTAMIAVPLVVLGLRGGLQRPDARIVSLDQPPVHATAPRTRAAAPQHPVVPQVDPAPDTTPFRASLTPFSAMGLGDVLAPAETASAPAPAAAVPGEHTLTVAASDDCWYEITDADGNRIDSGMLHAGDTRTWHTAGPVHVTLGNAGAVTVTEDGQPYPLATTQRANVARFDLFQPAAPSERD